MRLDGKTIYHVCNKSIEKFVIFNNELEYNRMLESMVFYQFQQNQNEYTKFSLYRKGKDVKNLQKSCARPQKFLVRIIAYCLMPTHFHLILEPMEKNGHITFIRRLLNSYSRYFNLRHKRRGPLWVGRTRKIWVDSDEYYLYLTKYVHCNPVKSNLVKKPEDWPYSSYQEYMRLRDSNVCDFESDLSLSVKEYKAYIEASE